MSWGRARQRSRGRRLAAGAAVLGFAGALCGCQGPDFTEKRALASPLMRFDDDPTEEHFRRKSTDSREASAGGRGGGAGGGCGCY